MESVSARSSARIPELDGLRGLAALSVVAFHLALRAPLLYGAAGPVVGHLDLGVEVFFVLSGFLVWRPFQASLVMGSRLPNLGSYAMRRSARIWPAYLLALAAIVVVGASTVSGPWAFLKHATLTYTYFEHRGGDGVRVAWTLVVELSFYLFVPVFAFLAYRFGSRARSLAVPVALVVIGAVFQWLVAMDLHTWRAIRILPPAMLTLGVGMLFAAVALGSSRGGTLLRRVADRPACCYVAALGCFVALVMVVPHGAGPIAGRPGDRVVQALLQAAIAALLVLPVAVGSRTNSRVRTLLRRPSLVYLGLISFGVYLWHLPMLHLFRDLVRDRSLPTATTGWALAIGATFALAVLSWHFVEHPILQRLPPTPRTAKPIALDEPATS